MKFTLRNPFKKEEAKIKPLTFILGIILGFVILVVVLAGAFSWGVYKLDWRTQAVEEIVSVLPFPAARVDSTFISFYDYLKNFDAANKYYDKQRKSGFGNIPSVEQLKKVVLEDRLIKNILVERIAANLGIKVADSDVQSKLNDIIKSSGTIGDLTKFLADNYGLNIAEYEKYFILPNLYYDKAELKIENDAAINGESRQKIDKALAELKAGQNFDAVLKKYSEGANNADEGLTGNFLRGELPKTLEDQLFSMSIGSYTDVITLPGSYSIIKLMDKNIDKGVLTLKAIMVKIKTLDDLVQAEKSKSKIAIYAY